MSDKALNPATLELTQKIQTHFPRNITSDILRAWNGVSVDVLSAKLFEVFGKFPSSIQESVSRDTFAGTTYPVTVDYFLILEQMIAAGRYDWKNLDITRKHFPISSEKRDKRDKEEVVIELVHFNREIESDEAIRELNTMGLRPAELPELLAFGAAYPEKQREFPIIALGSVWQYWGGYRLVPYLGGGPDGRYLSLSCFGDRWDSYDRFAAFRN